MALLPGLLAPVALGEQQAAGSRLVHGPPVTGNSGSDVVGTLYEHRDLLGAEVVPLAGPRNAPATSAG